MPYEHPWPHGWRWLTGEVWVREVGALMCNPDATGVESMQTATNDARQTTAGVVTNDLLEWTDHYELRRDHETIGVYGWSDTLGWFGAVAVDDGWETLAATGSAKAAREQVKAACGRGRWVRRDSRHNSAW